MFSKKLQNDSDAIPISPTPDLPAAPGPTAEAVATEDTDIHDGLRSTAPTRRDEDTPPQATQTTETLSTCAHNHAHPIVALGGCIVAEKAWTFANNNDSKLQALLQEIGYEGSYVVQAGFDEEIFRLKKGLLQQVTIFLGSDISAACAERVAAAFHPFPVDIHTPKMTHMHQPPHSSLWRIWEGLGIHTATVGYGTTTVLGTSNVGDNQPNIAGPSNSGARGDVGGGHGGSVGHLGDLGKGKENQGEGRGEDQGKGGDRVSPQDGTCGAHTFNTCKFSLTFQSDLTVHWADTTKKPTTYIISARVAAQVEDNADFKSPACDTWRNQPWLRATFETLANTQADTPDATLDFRTDSAQVKITTGGMKTWCLDRFPQQTDDPVKVTVAKGWLLTLKGIIGPALGLGFDGSMSRNSTNERSVTKWSISRKLTQKQTTSEALWEYTHNNQFHSPQAENSFCPLPSVTFSLNRKMVTTPKIGFETIIHFKRSVAPKKVCQNIANSERITLPAYSTFIQKAGVMLDLPEQTDGQWDTPVDADDALQESEIGTEKSSFTQVTTPLEEGLRKSQSKVTFTRALEGRVYPAEAQTGENICFGLWSRFKYWVCCGAAT